MKFFGNLDVIITCDVYQVQPICDARIFRINMNNIDSLATNFWMEKIKCYELKQVMCQSDEQFINILNQFRIATQSQFDIDIISNQCFRTPLENPKLQYLFYINEARFKHYESTFLRSDGYVYIFCLEDKHHNTCPTLFQLQNDPNFIAELLSKVRIKKNMLVIIQNTMV